MGRGQLPMNHPQFFNRSRKNALADADVVVLAGTPLDFRMKYGGSIPPDAKIIQLDLDETLIGQNRSADIGLVGNLGANLDAIRAELTNKGGVDFSDYAASLRQIEDVAEAAMASQLNSDEVPIDPLRLCREIADYIATDDQMIVIGDGGDIVAQSSKVLKVPEHGTWMDPGPLGTLGVGMPFALAAQLSNPDKRVMIIYGDGSFGLNGFEFDTAVRFGLPIVGIVGNDAAWGQMMRPQAMLYGNDRLVATELNYTRYDKVVEALGGHGEHVVVPDDIGPAIERAFASGKPALVNVEMRQDVDGMKGSTYV
jgi:acetolactate synthase I/II/III large subunit